MALKVHSDLPIGARGRIGWASHLPGACRILPILLGLAAASAAAGAGLPATAPAPMAEPLHPPALDSPFPLGPEAPARQAASPLPGVTGADPCPPAASQRALSNDPAPLLRPGGAAAAPGGEDYRQRLATTAHGWPRLAHWCLWIEPRSDDPAARLWEERWQQAVQQALEPWQQAVALTLVHDPARAQVHLQRRRPPRIPGPDGRLRASHGRAILRLVQVERAGRVRLEPAVEVLISPAQRQDGIAATALHELGHAFGLWGHSDDPADAMAAVPGAQPVLQLSRRDRATLRWLQAQPTRIGTPLTPAAAQR